MTAELLRAFAQRFAKLRRVIDAGRQQRGESIARNARREQRPARGRRRIELAELADHRVAYMHAEVVVHDVQLICIDIEGAPRAPFFEAATTARARCSNAGRVYRPLIAS